MPRSSWGAETSAAVERHPHDADRSRSCRADVQGSRAELLAFVTADGAGWIRDVVAERAPDAIVCLDTFHVIKWATDALDEVRRVEWNHLRAAGADRAAKGFKGLRFLLRRNWENLTMRQREAVSYSGEHVAGIAASPEQQQLGSRRRRGSRLGHM